MPVWSTHLVADPPAFDDRTQDMAGVFERVAVEQRQVTMLARFKRTDSVIYAQNARRRQCDHLQRLPMIDAVAEQYTCLEQHHTRFRHVALMTRLQGYRDSGFDQLSGSGEREISHVAAAPGPCHRRMKNHRHAGSLDLVHYQVRVRSAGKNEIEFEFLRQP